MPLTPVAHAEQLARLLPSTACSNGPPSNQVRLDQDDDIELDLTAVHPEDGDMPVYVAAGISGEPLDGIFDSSETAVPSPDILAGTLTGKQVDDGQHDGESFYEQQPAKLTWYLGFSAFTASLGMFLFGYHISELSASQFILTCASIDTASLQTPRNPNFNLPWCIPMSATLDFAVISTMLSVGGLLGSMVSSALTRFIGRKGVLAFAATIQVVSPVVMASAVSYTPLLIGRILAGIGAGAAASVNAAYLADIAPDAWRGFFGSLTQVMLNLGLLLCAIMNILFANLDSWRVVLIVSVIPALLQLMCVPWIATSPRDVASWYPLAPLDPDPSPESLEADPVVHLLRRLWGQDVDDAVVISALARLRPLPLPPKPAAKEDAYDPRMGTGTDGSISGRTLIGSSSIGRLRGTDHRGRHAEHTTLAKTAADNPTSTTMSTASARSRRRRSQIKRPVAKPATIWEFITTKRYRCSLGILSLAHFSLQASGITLYFSYSHSILTLLFSPDTAKLVFALSIAYHVVLIFVCGRLLDTHGRRPLFLAAYTVMGISAFLLNTASILRVHWLALGAFFGAVTGFAMGMGNVPYVLISEVVDGRAVASAAAVSLTVNWTTQGVYMVAFLPLLVLIKSWVFVLIGSITLAAGWAAYRWVPETWGRSGVQVLEEMNAKPRKEWKGICKEEGLEAPGPAASSQDSCAAGAAVVDGNTHPQHHDDPREDENPSDFSAMNGDPTSYGTAVPLHSASMCLPPLCPPQVYPGHDAHAAVAPTSAWDHRGDTPTLDSGAAWLSAPPTHQLYSLSAFARTVSTDQLSVTETSSLTTHNPDNDSPVLPARKPHPPAVVPTHPNEAEDADEEQATSLPGSELTSRAVTPVVCFVAPPGTLPPLPQVPPPGLKNVAYQQPTSAVHAFAHSAAVATHVTAHVINGPRVAANRVTVLYPGHVGALLQGLAASHQGGHERTRTM